MGLPLQVKHHLADALPEKKANERVAMDIRRECRFTQNGGSRRRQYLPGGAYKGLLVGKKFDTRHVTFSGNSVRKSDTYVFSFRQFREIYSFSGPHVARIFVVTDNFKLRYCGHGQQTTARLTSSRFSNPDNSFTISNSRRAGLLDRKSVV